MNLFIFQVSKREWYYGGGAAIIATSLEHAEVLLLQHRQEPLDREWGEKLARLGPLKMFHWYRQTEPERAEPIHLRATVAECEAAPRGGHAYVLVETFPMPSHERPRVVMFQQHYG